MSATETISLYVKHRPKLLKDVVGQTEAVNILRGYIKNGGIPRCLLLTGISGSGKTSLARILADKVECHPDDLRELNCATTRGIDDVRAIQTSSSNRPHFGKSRVWVLDECAKITSDGQTALLKTLEDVPKYNYYFLCTTDPHKLLPTIRTRAVEIQLQPLSQPDLCSLIGSVIDKEIPNEKDYPPIEVIEKIAEAAQGSARKAINILESVMHLPTVDQQLSAITSPDAEKTAYNLTTALLWEKPSWKKVQEILSKLVDTNYEGIRQLVLSNVEKTMLDPKGNHERAYAILVAFEAPFHDTRKSGLIRAAYEVMRGSQN